MIMPTKEQNTGSRPTLIDVARHAGVSIASVSRVLNNIPPISPELRLKVESATRALGYTTRKSTSPFQPSVVALIGDAQNTYFSEILAGIQDQATRNGYLVTIIVSDADEGFSERFRRWLTHTSTEGLILCSSTGILEEDLMRIRDFSDLPMAAINRTFSAARIPSIRIDYERAIAKAVRHAIQFRHRRIAFINGNEGSYSSRTKRAGVENTLEELGYPLEKDVHIERSATVEGGFEAMNMLFDLPVRRRPTAVIASSDMMALGAMHAIRSRGLSIPADISVLGFDDIAMAAHGNPPLTTIAPPKFEMGAKAMQFILRKDDGRQSSGDDYIVMESPLIVRESSGPCPE